MTGNAPAATRGWYHLTGGWCLTLRLLALPWAGHPDYREEWRV